MLEPYETNIYIKISVSDDICCFCWHKIVFDLSKITLHVANRFHAYLVDLLII